MDSLNSRVRANLIDFTKWARELGQESADLPYANDDDRSILADEAERLASAVESLIKTIEMNEALVFWTTGVLQYARDKDIAKLSVLGPFNPHALIDLSMALTAAWRIGGRSIENPIMKRMQKASIAYARQKRQLKSKEIDDVIIRHAKPVWKRQPTARTSAGKIASEITESVNRDLPHRLKESAIEKRVRKLMKSRTIEQSSD
jgi:hypothetical protein